MSGTAGWPFKAPHADMQARARGAVNPDGGVKPKTTMKLGNQVSTLRWTDDWLLRCEIEECEVAQTVSGHYCETHWQNYMAQPDCPVKPLSWWGYGL